MLQRILNLFAVLICCLAVCGCMARLTSGSVINKRFTPAHDETEMVTYDGEMYFPQTNHVPDEWYIAIGATCEDGKYRTSWYKVSQEVHDRAKMGDWMNFD